MTAGDWSTANQTALARELDRIRQRLAARLDGRALDDDAEIQLTTEGPFALDRLCHRFGLSGFERDVVLLCAGVEMDTRIAALVADAHGDGVRRTATFGLALASLSRPHWSALSPESPLRQWRLVEPIGSDLTTAPLRVDERVLHFLAGVDALDERLRGVVHAMVPAGTHEGDPDPHEPPALPARIAGRVGALPEGSFAQIVGADRDERLDVAATACAVLGVHALRLRAADVPTEAVERDLLGRLVTREAWLQGALLVIDIGNDDGESRALALLESTSGPLFVCAADAVKPLLGKSIVFDLARTTPADRLVTWQRAVGEDAEQLNGALGMVAQQFDLNDAAIRAVAAEARPAVGSEQLATRLWDGCRAAARPRLDALAQRIEAMATWNDLVVPEPQRKTLLAVATQVKNRHRVYDDWGFAEKGVRGLGLTALFTGGSGTGKTMAAEVLARELRLDLYRIDLASVVSKYIGETEKNLKRLFDAAEGSGAVLLFDEADALFGKRSEVKDSHDRYANIEISYLLQRMEAYRGLAILTSNLKQNVDQAFVRRIRFIVPFPFPDQEHRAAIWRGIFPERTPVAALDYARLAQLNVAGGHIRNIALAGAFLAADRREPVSMPLLAEAARSEYAKLERPLSEAETRGWL